MAVYGSSTCYQGSSFLNEYTGNMSCFITESTKPLCSFFCRMSLDPSKLPLQDFVHIFQCVAALLRSSPVGAQGGRACAVASPYLPRRSARSSPEKRILSFIRPFFPPSLPPRCRCRGVNTPLGEHKP